MLSVILAVLNGERFIEQALESALEQAAVAEVIVVDDGSSDASAILAARFPRVTVLTQPNRGPGAARNLGVRHARQPFLAFLDVDDLWLPEKSELQLAALAGSSRAYASCGFEYFSDVGAALPKGARADWLLRAHRAPIPSSLLIARKLFEVVGDFDERLRSAEDVDWFMRAEASGLERRTVDRVLVRKRLHDSNVSLNTPGNALRLMAVLRERCRRRAEGTAK